MRQKDRLLNLMFSYMWGSFIWYSLLSLFIIYIAHQCWIYITEKYAKKKYIVSSQIEKYKNMVQELSTIQPEPDETLFDDNEKTELEDFMKEL